MVWLKEGNKIKNGIDVMENIIKSDFCWNKEDAGSLIMMPDHAIDIARFSLSFALFIF